MEVLSGVMDVATIIDVVSRYFYMEDLIYFIFAFLPLLVLIGIFINSFRIIQELKRIRNDLSRNSFDINSSQLYT